MGLDQSYRAIPGNSPILMLAARHETWGCYLELYGFDEIAESTLIERASSVEFIEYASLAAATREAAHIGLAERTVDIYRHWDMLHYLLCETRRRCEPEDATGLATKAIIGGAQLGETVRAVQGVPVRHLTPKEVGDVYFWMCELPKDALREHWDPPAMVEAGVYKMHVTNGEADLEYLRDDLENLKDFYSEAFAFDEGVLAFCG